MLYDILRIGMDVRHQFNQQIKPFDLTYQQWQVLKLLNSSAKGYLSSTEIVESLNSDKATVSEILKKLQRKEMVKIEKDENDKRKKNISISGAMSKHCDKLKAIEADYWEELTKDFTEEELKSMDILTAKISRSVNEYKKNLQ